MSVARTAARGCGDPGVAAPVTVQRLAVLLQAGLTPAQAWTHLAESGDDVAADVCAAAGAGSGVPEVLAARADGWREVAVAWRVATVVGAPLAPSLRALADALRDAEETRDDVRVALAEPRTTARLVAWLPLVAVGLGAVLGFDPLRALTHPIGLGCLIAGGLLMVTAHRWTAALVARAQPGDEIPGLQSEIVAIALSGGVSIARALDVIRDAGGGEPLPATESILALSRAAGAPAVELLRADAAAQRHRARTDGRLRAARLSSRLLLPLGVCTLPAFLLLGVGPMLLSVLGATPLVL